MYTAKLTRVAYSPIQAETETYDMLWRNIASKSEVSRRLYCLKDLILTSSPPPPQEPFINWYKLILINAVFGAEPLAPA
jgi:hypothetical protein